MKKILILITIAFLIVTSISVYYLRKHWCSEISINKATLGEEILKESSLYQCADNSLVVWLQKDNAVVDVFAINTEIKKVGDVNSSSFFKFSSGIFAWEMPLKPVFLGEIQAKNDDINPRLNIEPTYIEFFPYNNDKKIVISK